MKKGSIIQHIIGLLLAVSALVIYFIDMKAVTKDNWYYSLVVFFTLIYMIVLVERVHIWRIKKYNAGIRYNIFLLLEENKNSLVDFQKYCKEDYIKMVNKEILRYTGKDYNINEKNVHKYEKDIINDIKQNAEIDNKKLVIKEIKEKLSDVGLSYHMDTLNDYYTNKLLDKDFFEVFTIKSIASVILSIVSTITLTIIANVSYIFWIFVLSTLTTWIVGNVTRYKKDCEEYNENYIKIFNNIKKNFDEFEKQKDKINE